MYDVIALGELIVDFAFQYACEVDGYPVMAAHPGGAPANFLAAIQKFGGRTALISKVGSDAFGKMLLSTLETAGINTDSVATSDEVFTTLAFVTFDEEHNRDFSFSRKPGADTCLKKEEVRFHLINETTIFHFGSLSLTDDPARETTRLAVTYAKQKGKTISFDPNLRKPLWKSLDSAKEEILWGLGQSDIVKLSDDEMLFLFGSITVEEAATRLLCEYGVKLVYITLGKHGCFFMNQNASGMVPALDVENVLDTTGAGDIFGGSAMWALLQTGKKPEDLELADLGKIVHFACASASISTTKFGGISSIPPRKEMLEQYWK